MTALKKFGIGILWAILLPFILVGVALVGVFGVFDFVIEFGIMIVNFFRGKKLFPMYPEDERAYQILQRAIDKKNGELQASETPAPAPQQVFVQQNFYTTPGAMPPGMNPGQLPPNYTQYPGMNQGALPPGYAPLPPQQQPGILPESQPQQQAMPPRPDLARLPEFNPADYSHKETDTIDIDVDGGDEE